MVARMTQTVYTGKRPNTKFKNETFGLQTEEAFKD